MGQVVELEQEATNEVRIRELMIRWETWRDARRRETLAQLGYGDTFLKQCLDDMPSRVCPGCRGKNPDCVLCEGSGKIDLDPKSGKINPAFIHTTHRSPDDETSEKIDRIMCRLKNRQKTFGYYLILLQEYTRIGTQKIKAERVNLSYGAYKTKLSRAHKHIEDGLYE